jgi:hypothetical protein
VSRATRPRAAPGAPSGAGDSSQRVFAFPPPSHSLFPGGGGGGLLGRAKRIGAHRRAWHNGVPRLWSVCGTEELSTVSVCGVRRRVGLAAAACFQRARASSSAGRRRAAAGCGARQGNTGGRARAARIHSANTQLHTRRLDPSVCQ